MPNELRASSWRSTSDEPATSSIAFGRSAVSRPMRVPLPAARMTARDADMSVAPGDSQRDGRPERLDLHAAKNVCLHGGDHDERGHGAEGPDFGQCRNEADECLKQDEVCDERALDQLPSPHGQPIGERAMTKLVGQ